jgi:hypothetical protein
MKEIRRPHIHETKYLNYKMKDEKENETDNLYKGNVVHKIKTKI